MVSKISFFVRFKTSMIHECCTGMLYLRYITWIVYFCMCIQYTTESLNTFFYIYAYSA